MEGERREYLETGILRGPHGDGAYDYQSHCVAMKQGASKSFCQWKLTSLLMLGWKLEREFMTISCGVNDLLILVRLVCNLG